MRKIVKSILLVCAALTFFVSCKETETYAEQKKYETSRIGDFIANRGIKVISEDQFREQGYTTNIDENEFVLFASQGVYMQIVNKGTGEKLKSGKTAAVLVRYFEWNINGDSAQISNEGNYTFATQPDKMVVSNNSGTFSATFESGTFMKRYKSAQVPAGWLVPFSYINLGRPVDDKSSNAIVNLIVPHDKGQAFATSNVYACYYTLDIRKEE